jgi:DnaK suppressor protein
MGRTTAESREVLLRRKESLLRRIRERESAGTTEATATTETGGRDGSSSTEVFLSMERRELLELREIDAALERLEAGRYGICENCGHAIGRHRLQAIPEATYCVSCGTGARPEALVRHAR